MLAAAGAVAATPSGAVTPSEAGARTLRAAVLCCALADAADLTAAAEDGAAVAVGMVEHAGLTKLAVFFRGRARDGGIGFALD